MSRRRSGHRLKTPPPVEPEIEATGPPSSGVADSVLASIQALEDQIDQMRRNAHPTVEEPGPTIAAAAVFEEIEVPAPAIEDPAPAPPTTSAPPASPTPSVAPRTSRRRRQRAARPTNDAVTSPDVPVTIVPVDGVPEFEEPAPAPAPSRRGRRDSAQGRRTALIVVGALLAVVVGITALLVLTSGDDAGDSRDSASSGSGPSRPTERAATFTFDPVTTPEGVVVERAWVLRGPEGGQLVGTLSFSNPTDAPIETSYVEVIPKSLAKSVNDIRFEPEPTVLRADPVVEYKVTLRAKSDLVARYDIPVAEAGVSQRRLAAWAADAEEAARAVATTTTTTTTTTTPTTTTPTTVPAPLFLPPASVAPPPPPPPPPPAGPPGAIVVRTVSGSSGTFRYAGPGGSAALSTSGGQQSVQSAAISIAPGTYAWSQTSAPPGSAVLGISCNDGESGGSGATATYRIQPGETVVCTWTNS